MSKDRLEEFIDDHRGAFDDELPQMDLWNKIEGELHTTPNPKRGWVVPTRIAAAIALLMAVGLWFFLPSKGKKTSSEVAHVNVSPRKEILERNPELAELSAFYTKKISDNKNKLVELNHNDPELFRDLRYMESMFDTLQAEWKRNAHKSDEQLVRAMIANYRTRANLLDNVVRRVELNNRYSRGGESVPAFVKGQ